MPGHITGEVCDLAYTAVFVSAGLMGFVATFLGRDDLRLSSAAGAALGTIAPPALPAAAV